MRVLIVIARLTELLLSMELLRATLATDTDYEESVCKSPNDCVFAAEWWCTDCICVIVVYRERYEATLAQLLTGPCVVFAFGQIGVKITSQLCDMLRRGVRMQSQTGTASWTVRNPSVVWIQNSRRAPTICVVFFVDNNTRRWATE